MSALSTCSYYGLEKIEKQSTGSFFQDKFQSLFAAPSSREHDRGQNRAKIAPVGEISGLRLCFVE